MIKKRVFDIIFSFTLLIILIVPMFIIWIITSICFMSNGLFFQTRVGQYGMFFTIYKYKTLYKDRKRISKWGLFLRKTKCDELPQLINIIKGDMSFVGPRPDLPGLYDTLKEKNRVLLKLKPGLTSETTLKYFEEEKILQMQNNPQRYNNEVIFQDKVKMNLNYYYNRNFLVDLKIILKTIIKILEKNFDFKNNLKWKK
ncbi:sugar transferase [Polaribacter sp. MSW13]|uniref:Sugar transferase n=1 Tax=Polaribacter marinus TaxID=2916838 RepID=A0A9X1VK09_9FLAO|nr:sugar transferase [Polaribacter marinus]MCI2227552.1 sugar transferase [Polaribacter marinus]